MTNKEKFLAGQHFQVIPGGAFFFFKPNAFTGLGGIIIDAITGHDIGYLDEVFDSGFITFPATEHFEQTKTHLFDNLIFQNHE